VDETPEHIPVGRFTAVGRMLGDELSLRWLVHRMAVGPAAPTFGPAFLAEGESRFERSPAGELVRIGAGELVLTEISSVELCRGGWPKSRADTLPSTMEADQRAPHGGPRAPNDDDGLPSPDGPRAPNDDDGLPSLDGPRVPNDDDDGLPSPGGSRGSPRRIAACGSPRFRGGNFLTVSQFSLFIEPRSISGYNPAEGTVRSNYLR